MGMKEKVMEFYEERAAIFEFDGGYPRDKANSYAMCEVARVYGTQWVEIIQWELKRTLTKSA